MTVNCVNIGRDEESLNTANINLLVGFNKTREIYKAYIDFGIFSLYFIVVISKTFVLLQLVTDTLMQIWKSANILLFTWK